MKIQHEGWTLYDYDPKLKRQVWYIENPDGSMTWRTDYEVQPTIDINQAQRNMTQRGWKGDYHHIASVPLNILYDSGVARAQAEGDDKFVSKWLNDIDNRAWRAKDGTV